jgi:hypothetical protein
MCLPHIALLLAALQLGCSKPLPVYTCGTLKLLLVYLIELLMRLSVLLSRKFSSSVLHAAMSVAKFSDKAETFGVGQDPDPHHLPRIQF